MADSSDERKDVLSDDGQQLDGNAGASLTEAMVVGDRLGRFCAAKSDRIGAGAWNRIDGSPRIGEVTGDSTKC